MRKYRSFFAHILFLSKHMISELPNFDIPSSNRSFLLPIALVGFKTSVLLLNVWYPRASSSDLRHDSRTVIGLEYREGTRVFSSRVAPIIVGSGLLNRDESYFEEKSLLSQIIHVVCGDMPTEPRWKPCSSCSILVLLWPCQLITITWLLLIRTSILSPLRACLLWFMGGMLHPRSINCVNENQKRVSVLLKFSQDAHAHLQTIQLLIKGQ